MNEDESWDLLRYVAIGEESPCPPELVKIGQRIAHNCQGLPLQIIAMGSLLRESQNLQTWKTVADDRKIQNHEMLRVMRNSIQEELPQQIKACFLYMMSFPQYHRISASKLVNLWVSEGFLEPNRFKTLEDVAREHLWELMDRNLILVHELMSTRGIKTTSIHSAAWPFYDVAATEHKLFYAIKNFEDNADPSHRRFSIHKNILLSIKDLYGSISSVSTTRSLLCTGPYHPYPLRVSFRGLKLLRVLDALSIRFYSFPDEIVKLVLLRFLAFTFNRGEIPASISMLRNLQFLIVSRHFNIKTPRVTSFLPKEIWNMKQLRHLEAMECDIPKPSDVNDVLPNLLTLLNVSAPSCTKEVLERTPNLKKLGVRIELAWDAEAEPLRPFDHIAHLHQLETLKCVVVNPLPETQIVVLLDSVSFFSSNLKKLTLYGCGFSWEKMEVISGLRELQVLKLRHNAFQGPNWKLNEGGFVSLEFLLLEDMDIEHWTADESIFPKLERLAIHHCYKLLEIPVQILHVVSMQKIELVGCSNSVVDSASQGNQDRGNLKKYELTTSEFASNTQLLYHRH